MSEFEDLPYASKVHAAYARVISTNPFYNDLRRARPAVTGVLIEDAEFVVLARAELESVGRQFEDDWAIQKCVDRYLIEYSHEARRTTPFGTADLIAVMEQYRPPRGGDDPWYASHVFNSFVQALVEQPDSFFTDVRKVWDVRPRVVELLINNDDFIREHRERTSPLGQILEDDVLTVFAGRCVTAHIDRYRQKAFRESPFSNNRLIEYATRRLEPPCTNDDLALILPDLCDVFRRGRNRYITPQAADADVIRAMQKKGTTHISTTMVRNVITWAVQVEHPDVMRALGREISGATADRRPDRPGDSIGDTPPVIREP